MVRLFPSGWRGYAMLGGRMRTLPIERLALGSFQFDLNRRWAELRGVLEVVEFPLRQLRVNAG